MIDHRQAFLDEARELLVELESALLELDQNRGDPEIVARAFRALHTIKGSGAMFGFDDIAGFAHHLESAFDQLRKGQLKVTADLINLSLGASDQIKKMLDAAAGQGAADPNRSEAILTELRFLRGTPDAEPARSPAPKETALAPEGGPMREWRIRFRPAPEALLNGTNPLRLLRELRELGELQVHVDTAAIPSLTEIVHWIFGDDSNATLIIRFLTQVANYTVQNGRLMATFGGQVRLDGTISLGDGIVSINRSRGRITKLSRY